MTPVADMIRSFAGRHAMVSFERPDQMEICAEICHSVILDNGAFSAWKQNKPHDFAGYAAWCKIWLRHPAVEWAVIPDKIDGSESENDDLLKAWKFGKECSVPVYHMHESLDRLERLCIEYPRVALGSSGDFAIVGNKKWWARMAEIMAVCCDRDGKPYTKLHGLRMLNPGVFSKIPLASADSTNVARNVGYDNAWRNGTYLPHSKMTKALILMERIERHASASRWPGTGNDYHNDELLG